MLGTSADMADPGNTNAPAAGWYPDPRDTRAQRYWDGTGWTAQTRPGMPSPPLPPPYGAVPAGGHHGRRPDTYLVWAVLTTFCCCVPLGIPAIVNASKVDRAWKSGDVEAAHHHSAEAKKFTLIAAAVGAVFGVGSLLVQLLLAAAASS